MEAITEIAVVTIPAYSHQASILEFCKRLVLLQNHGQFHVTCFIPTLGSPPSASMALIQSLPSSITCTFLPPVNLHDQPLDLPLEVQLQLAVSRSMPLVREALKSLGSSSSLAAMVAEPLSIEALAIAKELNIISYLYFPCSAMMLSLCFYSAKLNQRVTCGHQFRDLPVPIEIPGCVPVNGKDLPDNHQDRSSSAYEQFLQRCQLYHLAEGILLNSFEEMEAGAIRAWQHEEPAGKGQTKKYPSVHAIGPIIKTGSSIEPNRSDRDCDKCLRWLDTQPPSSVLFVSFGSGGRLSQAQINELALGLELSDQRFLWVNVKSPSDRASASYLSDKNEEDPLHFLPSGFLERTKERGLVMASWAPQVQVLGHSSAGGFLSHCGWNSILESIAEGVSIIAWPLFAEQRTNAAMLADGLKVAIRPRLSDNNSGIVEKEEISRVIKCIMEDGDEEGEEIRRRMKELKDAASCALMEDGSSTKTLSNLALKWRNLNHIN
ncbi:hydroquinone glucosyltransferase-like [Neltuma alba]|uniref:hydroquinone glucosyltransferase-like n=1 Tax=Neltuma alba TaxID=207710 RepID=UPI0010A511BB|nr:hydroquinone glucosyltransferase-like [Prosopis alba]